MNSQSAWYLIQWFSHSGTWASSTGSTVELVRNIVLRSFPVLLNQQLCGGAQEAVLLQAFHVTLMHANMREPDLIEGQQTFSL